MRTFRGWVRCLATLAFGLASAGRALAVPSVDEMLAEARQGRAGYIDALGQVEAAAPSITDKNILYPYINALDTLQTIGAPYGMDTTSSGPLPNLALALTMASIKFVRIDQDTVGQVGVILKWSQDDARFEIGQAQHQYIVRATDKDDLYTWLLNTAAAMDTLTSLGAESYVMTAYNDLQEDATKGLMAMLGQLSNADVIRMIRGFRDPTTFETFFTELERQILASNDAVFIKLGLAWDVAGSTQLATMAGVATGITQLPGEIAGEGAVKLLQMNDSPDPSEAVQLLDTMSQRQQVDFLQNLLDTTKNQIADGQVEFLYLTLVNLVPRLQQAGLAQDVELANALLNRVAMMRASSTGSFEGTFHVTLADNTPGILTVVDMGDSNFIMCLSLTYNGVPVYYSFFNVAYNFQDETYEAHRFAVDDPRYVMPDWPEWYMKFTLKIDGANATMTGTFSDTRKFQDFTATRAATFDRDWGTPHGTVTSLNGGYNATTTALDATDVRLTITQLGQKVAGSLEFNGGAATVDLVYGYLNQRSGYFAITSAELESGRWVQVRGQVVNGSSIIADYILGGEGTHLDHVTFTKTDH